ncbi:hypothetical protein CU097_013501 [Rhizopus azygosporus]|uniref:Uncharacterized protein n=1 Tax=Rhizopus azygosporus TaxID=86630 RepID=A0A367JUA2_RHIAZ|nr:hypothetical protein CU097_013501 [Rhizopus azygosporus]
MHQRSSSLEAVPMVFCSHVWCASRFFKVSYLNHQFSLRQLEKEQYPAHFRVVTTKEGARTIAEINFDPTESTIDEILRSGISFDDLMMILISDNNFNFVRVCLTNFPFLSEAKLLDGLKTSLDSSYYMESDCGVLNIPKDRSYSSLNYCMSWGSSDKEGFIVIVMKLGACCS